MANSQLRNMKSIRTSSSHGWGGVHLSVNMEDTVLLRYFTSQVSTKERETSIGAGRGRGLILECTEIKSQPWKVST